MTRDDGMSDLEGEGQEVRRRINTMFILKKDVNCLEIPMLASSRKPFGLPHPVLPGPPSSQHLNTVCDVSLPLFWRVSSLSVGP